MAKSRHAAWSRHFDAIGDELLRLTTICEVDLRAPGVIERILNGDATVCGKRNAIGFRKLRMLLIATFDSLGKTMDRLGAAELHEFTGDRAAPRRAPRRGARRGENGPEFIGGAALDV